MRASPLHARSFTFVLALGLVFACSSADPGSAKTDANTEAAAPTPVEPDTRERPEPRRPVVGDPAPPLSLATLTGSRVALPQSDADRAAVLIFGSFS